MLEEKSKVMAVGSLFPTVFMAVMFTSTGPSSRPRSTAEGSVTVSRVDPVATSYPVIASRDAAGSQVSCMASAASCRNCTLSALTGCGPVEGTSVCVTSRGCENAEEPIAVVALTRI